MSGSRDQSGSRIAMDGAGGLSAAERRIFTAAAEAMVGEPVPEAAVEGLAPFLRRLAAADRRQLSLLLRALEYAPLLTRLRRFSALAPEERTRHLAAWAQSRLLPRRQGASALRSLAMIAFYGREQSWPALGYHGPWLGRRAVETLPAPTLPVVPPPRPTAAERPGLIPGREAGGDLRLRAEVCVVGTGAGGAAVLARLAERGVAAVAVEIGGHPEAADFTQRELEMLPLLYREAGLRSTTDKAIGILQGRGVGGSTLHNTGLVFPPPPGVVERWRRDHGFPLAPAALDGYVGEVLESLRASRIPEERINGNNAALRRGAEALGWRFRVSLHNRAACSACGYCMLGCAYNRKFNSALTYLPRAVAAGARILSDARALRVEGRAGARRVVCELRGADGRPTGRRAVVEAPVVVLAAGALDSPALLLRSGLGGRRVGRGLRLHPAPTVSAVMPEPVVAWRGLPQSVIVEEFASFYEDGHGGWLFLPSAANWPALVAAVTPGLGAEHRRRMHELPRLAAAAVLLHDETEGRVTSARDGRPRARYWPARADREALRSGIHSLARLYLAAGAERVQLPVADAPAVRSEAELDAAVSGLRADRHRLLLNSVHPQGSLPMGTGPRTGAVDPHGRVWGEPGLYVADASVFPTSVGVPPQVTVMALATAIADAVAAERR